MARQAKMGKRKGRLYWETSKDGVTYNLGTNERKALKQFYQIHGKDTKPERRCTSSICSICTWGGV